jgi:arylsulfatase
MKRDPVDPLYAKRWDFDLPSTLTQPIDAPGRPKAHRDYLMSHEAMTAEVPNHEANWRRRHNNYINCMRDVDRNIVTVLDELDAAGMAGNTIIVLTSDHGDFDGAHRLHGKGATGYREQNNVPFIVVHPDVPGGRESRAVTSHLDIAPTLVAMTGASPEKRATITKGLKGKDLSPVLADPEKAEIDAVRDGMLFNYNMFAYFDGEFSVRAYDFIRKGGKGNKLKEAGIVPDLRKRGAIRSVFDGRYTYSRYFSPKQHHRPTTVEQIYGLNDVELYDIQTDPHERYNLAAGDRPNKALVLAMNEKMNRLIDQEVGDDPGDMMPGGIDAGWEVSWETMKGF